MDGLSASLKPLSLLELVAANDQPVTLADVAASCDVPRPTLHRWFGLLTEAGLLQRAPDNRRFELAPRASQLAFSILANRPAAALRHELLERIVREIGESCNITVMHGASVTYVDRVETTWPLRVTFHRGSQVPVHCSASGKLFLALMPKSKREMVLRDLPLERFTASTVCDRAALQKELLEIRKLGYALDREEYQSGLICLAVPITQKIGRRSVCVAALAVQAPVARVTHDAIVARLPSLQNAARALEATLT